MVGLAGVAVVELPPLLVLLGGYRVEGNTVKGGASGLNSQEIEEAEAASRCAEFAQKRKTSAVNTSNVHSHA